MPLNERELHTEKACQDGYNENNSKHNGANKDNGKADEFFDRRTDVTGKSA
jgi:hypothetical protein